MRQLRRTVSRCLSRRIHGKARDSGLSSTRTYMQVCPHDLCLVARKFLLIRGNLMSGQSFHVISRCRACCERKNAHAFAWMLILYGISSMTNCDLSLLLCEDCVG